MTKPSKKLTQQIKDFFIPPHEVNWVEFREVMPFFFLLTAAVIWMYSVYAKQVSSTWGLIGFTVLMLVHLVLYWSVFRWMSNQRSLRTYFIVQGLMVFVLVLFGGDFGLAIGLYASLIGHAVGVLRTSKDIFYFVPFFIILALLAIMVQSGAGVILDWAYVALPSILLSVFVAYMFRRLLQNREKTETLYKDLQKAHARLEAYAEQVEELTLAEERQRMARELHDTLAQELTGVVLQLEAVSTHIENQNNARAHEILQDAMSQSRVTLAEARKVIDGLRSSQTSGANLKEIVREEIARFERVAQIPCELIFQVNLPLEADLQDHVIRIISEGLNNIAKHAHASHAWLQVTASAGRLKIAVEDNGKGYSAGDQGEGQYGLLGIRERVALLEGRFTIDGQPGNGTRLMVEIPLMGTGETNE